MKQLVFNWAAAFFVAFTLIGFVGCIDQDFDEPPVTGLPSIEKNTSIADLKARHSLGADAQVIEDDVVIGGIVVADDESGNFFKKIILQDSTGGIEVRMDAIGLFNDFPIGREVFVRCQGLYLGDFNGSFQLNGGPDASIAELLITETVLGGERDQLFTPRTSTIDEFSNPALLQSLTNTLVQFENVQFISSSTDTPYADGPNKQSINHTIEDCNGNQILLRSSGFADFANINTPTGNGTITAIFSVFGDDKQLFIRDLSDVDFNGSRCSKNIPEPNTTIADLKAMHTLGDDDKQIPGDVIIQGIVVADDESGNYFKKMIVQDETGGIEVRINALDLYQQFPEGSQVVINCSNLYIGDFNGSTQINGAPETAIEESVFGSIIFAADKTLNISARATTVAELADQNTFESLVNTLVTFSNVQFIDGDQGKTYADENSSANRLFENCDGETLILRSSSFADFATETLPSGNGTLTGILAVFNADKQVFLRTSSDVSMNGERCDGSGGNTGGGGDETEVAIGDLRSQFGGGASSAPADSKITGIVISDIDNENLNGRNLILQNGEAGIVVRFESNHTFKLGEEVEVVVSNQELSEFNGLLQVNNVPNSNATSKGQGTLPAPREATVAEVLSNLEAWESTLVVISDVTLSGNSTFSGNITVTDATGSIAMFTRGGASFADNALPGGTVKLTAIVSQFNDPQLSMRNASDVE